MRGALQESEGGGGAIEGGSRPGVESTKTARAGGGVRGRPTEPAAPACSSFEPEQRLSGRSRLWLLRDAERQCGRAQPSHRRRAVGAPARHLSRPITMPGQACLNGQNVRRSELGYKRLPHSRRLPRARPRTQRAGLVFPKPAPGASAGPQQLALALAMHREVGVRCDRPFGDAVTTAF
jgi:hypothetical protein